MQKVKVKTNKRNGLSGKVELTKERLETLYSLIQHVYLADSRPWVIGYSGGKDSTCTLQIIWHSIRKLPEEQRIKPIYVISSDTFVETPVLVNYIDRSLEKIKESAIEQHMPIEAHKVCPQIDNTFWVNMIGRGYPAPYNRFRWCTDRLKIEPANRFIREKIADYGEVIIALGARRSESASRAQVMNNRQDLGDCLSRHKDLANAWVFTPIEDWKTDEVWTFLLNTPAPWGIDNRELVTMYRNAQSEECPLVIDKNTPSCGNSRFGCWTCTVVDKDSSMEAMIDKGEEWMEPLLEFRDWLADTKNPERKKDVRDFRRRSGKVQYWNNDGEMKLIWGPFKLEFRKEILRRLLLVQGNIRSEGPDPNETLISHKELFRIRQIWLFDEGDWEDSLPTIFKESTGETLAIMKDDWSGMGGTERNLLERVCEDNNLPIGLIRELFDAERHQHGMYKRSGIFNSIDAVLKKDWRSANEVFAEANISHED